jgi:methionine-rich copper-binding protein CopC
MKRLLGIFLTVLAVTLGSSLGATSPALAHDEIISTTPAADASVAPGQIKVSITFNEPAMQMGNHEGIEIQVTAPDGTAAVLPCLVVDGATIWAVDDAKAEGTYAVDWRSVSNDGHANSGTFNFEVAAGAALGEAAQVAPDCVSTDNAAGASPAGTADATPMAANEASLLAADSVAAPASGSKLDPLVGLGIGVGLLIVLSVLGALAAELQKRRRASKAALKKLKAEVEANPDMLRGL